MKGKRVNFASMPLLHTEDPEIVSMAARYRKTAPKCRVNIPQQTHNKTHESECDELYKKFIVIEDILSELPEIEDNIINSMCNIQKKSDTKISAHILSMMSAWLLLLIIYGTVFVMGLAVASYISCGIPIIDSLIFHHTHEELPEGIQKVVVTRSEDGKSISIKGVFVVAYYVYNITPYTGALSMDMISSYLPKANEVSITNDYCFGKNSHYMDGKAVNFGFKDENLKARTLSFSSLHTSDGRHVEYDGDNWESIEKGNIITFNQVVVPEDAENIKINAVDTSMYDIFTTHRLIGNNVQLILYKGLNQIRLLVTLNENLKLDGNFIANQLYTDCTNGFITLKFTATMLRFDTMLYSGNLLPNVFLPLDIPCNTHAKEDYIDTINNIINNQKTLFKKQVYLLKKLGQNIN